MRDPPGPEWGAVRATGVRRGGGVHTGNARRPCANQWALRRLADAASLDSCAGTHRSRCERGVNPRSGVCVETAV